MKRPVSQGPWKKLYFFLGNIFIELKSIQLYIWTLFCFTPKTSKQSLRIEFISNWKRLKCVKTRRFRWEVGFSSNFYPSSVRPPFTSFAEKLRRTEGNLLTNTYEYYMPKEKWPIWYIRLLYKMGHYFLDTLYIIFWYLNIVIN